VASVQAGKRHVAVHPHVHADDSADEPVTQAERGQSREPLNPLLRLDTSG
jgi:hypothetical protein